MPVKKFSDLYLRDVGKAFIKSLMASGSPHSYWEALERSVALVADYSEGEGWPPVGDITIDHIEDYFAHLQSREPWFGERGGGAGNSALSTGYINAQYRRLNRFFGWLLERGHVEENVMKLMKPPPVDENTVPLVSDSQIQDLLALLNPKLARTPRERFLMIRNRAILHLFVDTPGRLDEIAEMKLDDARPDDNRVRVMGKGGKERYMPIGNTPQAVLRDYLRARETKEPLTEKLWVSATGEAMSFNWLYLMMKRLGKRAKVRGLHPQMFRHTFAVNALRSSMPERILMNIGGWKKIPDTYFRVLGFEDAQTFHAKMSPGDRLGGGSTEKDEPKSGEGGPRPRGRL